MADDHGPLTEQVAHLRRLLEQVTGQDRTPLDVQDAFAAAANTLHDELLEHFGFEEECVFPFLSDTLSQLADEIRLLEASHDTICGALVRLQHLAQRDEGQAFVALFSQVLHVFERFDKVYSDHVAQEAALLNKAALQLSSDQRKALNDAAEGLL